MKRRGAVAVGVLAAWAVGLAGYAVGISLSVLFDWPTGPVTVWSLAAIGALVWALSGAARPGAATAAQR